MLFRSPDGVRPPAGTAARLEDLAAISKLSQLVRDRHAGEAGAHDRDACAVTLPTQIEWRLLRRLAMLERLGRRLWPVFGGGYLLVARKRVATLTPIRPRWRARRRLPVNGLVKPMNQQQEHKGARLESNR